jgi:hypothetical protein
MRVIWRRSVMTLALYAVVLHVILLGFLPGGSGVFAPIDPFSIICHTIGPTANPAEPPPGTIHFVPGRAIDQCDLCTAIYPPPAPDIAVNIDFKSLRVLRVLRPQSMLARSSLVFDPRLIRGPPLAFA